MDPHAVAAVTNVIFALFGTGLYVYGVRKGDIKPHLFSWFIWGLLMLIGGAVNLFEGALWSGWAIVAMGLMCMGVFILALKGGERDITRADKSSFVFALLAVPVWLITQEPLYAAIIVTIIDGAGAFPTMRKSWDKPYDEEPKLFSLFTLTTLLSVFAVSPFTLTTALYPTVITLFNASIVAILVYRRNVLRKKGETQHV